MQQVMNYAQQEPDGAPQIGKQRIDFSTDQFDSEYVERQAYNRLPACDAGRG